MFRFLTNIIRNGPGKEKTDEKKYRIGLVLSGGGARGFSHLGSVKALFEHGYSFDVIAGTSIGAVVGCILADGYTPDELLPMMTSSRLKSLIKTDLSRNGFMSLDGVRDFLEEVLSVKNIEELKTPFIAAATNLSRGEAHYFKTGDIADAVIASASVPIVFPPVVIDGEQYVDGGLVNNLPVRSIRSDCEYIIGFHVNPATLGLHGGHVKGMTQIAERTFHLSVRGNVLPDKHLCDIFIEHEYLESYTMFNFTKAKEIFEKGYDKTNEILSALPESKKRIAGENR